MVLVETQQNYFWVDIWKSKLWCQGLDALLLQTDCLSSFFCSRVQRLFVVKKMQQKTFLKSPRNIFSKFDEKLFENIDFVSFCWGSWTEAISHLKTPEKQFWLRKLAWGSSFSLFYSFWALYYSYMCFCSFKMLW